MSRRSYKTINLPTEVVAWIDALVKDKGPIRAPHPLGIESRDEFVRIAVALLGASVSSGDDQPPPIEVFRRLAGALESQSNPAVDSLEDDHDG